MEEQLAALVAKEEIRELARRYALAVDLRDLDALVELFVDDVDVGRHGRGRKVLRRWFDEQLRRFTTSIHFVVNHTVDVSLDDGTASGLVYTRIEREDGDHWVVEAALFEDVYERRDGRWCFVRRRSQPWYQTDLLDPPVGHRKLRWPGRTVEEAPLPNHGWPSWREFWGHGAAPAVRGRTIRLRGDGVDLVGDAYGPDSSPPVLLFHGGGQTRHAWGGTAAALAARGWYAISVDLRGHGDSDWSPDGRYGIERFAADVAAVARSFEQRPVLVGASLGGMASMLVVGELAPDAARALVLVDVTPRLEPAGVQRIMDFMRQGHDGFDSLEDAADAVAAYVPHRPRPSELSGLRKNLRQREDGRWYWHYDPAFVSGQGPAPGETVAERHERLVRVARSIRVPTLLVRGRMSDIVSQEGVDELLDLVPHAQVVDVAGAGHMVAGDRNDLFTGAVTEFLEASGAVGA